MGFTILLSDLIEAKGLNYLKRFGEVIISYGDPGIFANMLKGADAVITKFQKVEKEQIKKARQLKVIGKHGIGVDNIDLAYATQQGIKVVNVPKVSAETVAEFAVAAVLALARRIPQANCSLKNNSWDREQFIGSNFKDSVVGIIGFGGIGRLVATKLIPLGFKIIAFDPYVAQTALKVQLVPFRQLLRESDFITLHVPLQQKTTFLLDQEEFALMKRNAYLINLSRARVVNNQALEKALENKQLQGAWLDVFVQEPLDLRQKLFKRQDVVVTPHIAAFTRETQQQISLQISQEVVRVLQGKTAHHIVFPGEQAVDQKSSLNQALKKEGGSSGYLF